MRLGDHLIERKKGVGDQWKAFRLIGVTRSGIDLPKDPIGKSPGRYKLVRPGTIVYNPMRILLGSIGVMKPNEQPGIISPDYVVFETNSETLDPFFFFGWLKSRRGIEFIQQETRGAVRQRLKLSVLSRLEVDFPCVDIQRSRGVTLLKSLSALSQAEDLAKSQQQEIAKLRSRLFEQACE